MEPNRDSVAFGKRLLLLRNEKGISQTETAKKLGMAQTTYAGYETGKRNATVSLIQKLSAFFGVSANYLVDGETEKEYQSVPPEDSSTFPEDIQKHIDLYSQLTPAGRQAADDNIFTLLMFQQAIEKQAAKACDTRIDELSNYRSLRKSEQAFSAGHGVYLGPEAFCLIRVQDNELTRHATFCGAVDGDSMEPRYHDGNILLVNSDEEVDVGEIGIFTLDGHGFVKKRGFSELISLNPAYTPIPLDDSIRCNGKVIGILRPEWIVEN